MSTTSPPWPQARARIEISLAEQALLLFDDRGELVRRYSVSTSKQGPGERAGSNCTPRGRHIIRAKIGDGAPVGTVFVSRRPTGEIWSPDFAARHPGGDFILTRILWLCGCEPGVNRFRDVDTMKRYIYIHGTPDAEPMGVPRSHGCIRMRNTDIIHLFDHVAPGTNVAIC